MQIHKYKKKTKHITQNANKQEFGFSGEQPSVTRINLISFLNKVFPSSVSFHFYF